MTTVPECLRSTLELNSIPPTDLPAWIGDIAFASVDDSNLEEIVSFLGNAGGEANQVFWRKVHELPRSDEEWAALWYIGGEMTDESAAMMKARDRRVVEAIRSRFSHSETLVHELFRKR